IRMVNKAIALHIYPIIQYLGNISPTTSPALSRGRALKMLGAATKEKNIIPPIQTTRERR
ncbi:MAG: hypothetical protein AAB014_02840, partial [Nitrospirota bacterium]